MTRPRMFFLIIGTTHTGKTYFIRDLIKLSKQKVLVYDVNREEKYARLPVVNVQKLASFHKGKYRVIQRQPDQVIEYIINDYRNGLLILDDVDRYLSVTSVAWNDLIIGHRHMGLDLIAVFHSLNRTLPIFYENCTDIILFKTQEQPDKSINKLPKSDDVLRAFYQVESNKDPHYKVRIRCR
ncbi:MAG TPA: ATP-binding protein [bacterium]